MTGRVRCRVSEIAFPERSQAERYGHRCPEGTLPRRATLLGMWLAGLVVVLLGYTANLGGQIRHTEIRARAALGGDVVGEAPNEEGTDEQPAVVAPRAHDRRR